MRGLQSLTKDNCNKVKATVKEHAWYVVYDNINLAFRKHNQRTLNQDSFESGTTASVIMSKLSAELERDPDPLRHLCLEDLIPSRFDKCSIPVPTKKLLPVEKTVAYQLPVMKINQSSIAGNKEVLDAIMEYALELTQK
ncbi:hypothetical protein BGZ65_009297 [Modicella reniformis]|uniref:DUF6589 domain-containing protein n=1 Tax=Modicella reniformis TaxID=1440133 RepID=A0A9P6JG51_9FUNG|nr:hypothetical protein BGZ65_009297 [Modicella reniformis]